MNRSPLEDENPDRLYTVTGGRSGPGEIDLDLVTLIVSEADPSAGRQSEHVRILQLGRHPTSVVELASELGLPVSVVRILVADLLRAGLVSARHPAAVGPGTDLPELEFLKKVLVGLRNL
ncbi:DUF742 domain-containing protein [Amycolatopsis sp. 195334CR]|uniref:DUF742 domain-containing protein n=1 Tax=Amycolatopsis sp. 195334CR TaxID=2814588 RepID=UPI001A8D1219|nr:DUF742 domain-containing protein [Amycolatopsis sp. 195334CR]MBN6042018.1 DUF742 domain-containing protein [Amycolatopsis sp. 195334CR]